MSDPSLARLSARAAHLAGEAGVRLIWRRERPQSILYRFAVEAEGSRRDVVIKTPPPAAVPVPTRARLYPATDPEAKPALEFRALRAAHAHFALLGDPRLGVVEPLAEDPAHGAIALEFVAAPTLRELMSQPARQDAARAACRDAGRWLRHFHTIAGVTDNALRGTPGEVAEAVARLCSHLRSISRDPTLLERMEVGATRAARSLLPPSIRLGLGHGDFAARNVFVDGAGGLKVFDMLGRWQVPVYEDLATFTLGLRTAGRQLVPGSSPGGTPPQVYENELLHGYFGDAEVPVGELAVFELLVLLDRWSSLAATTHASAARGRLVWSSYRRLALRRLRDEARDRLALLERV